jgi:hypothetical protein
VLIRAATAAVIFVYGGLAVLNPAGWRFLDYVNLVIHEAGHVLFAGFEETIGVLGGSLLQVLVPVTFAGYFAARRQTFEAAVVLFWVAESLLYLSNYVADARAQVLPLLGGDGVTHDWNFLLGHWGLLAADQGIAGAIRVLATLLWMLSVAGCAWTAWNVGREGETEVFTARSGVVTITGRRPRYRAERAREERGRGR